MAKAASEKCDCLMDCETTSYGYSVTVEELKEEDFCNTREEICCFFYEDLNYLVCFFAAYANTGSSDFAAPLAIEKVEHKYKARPFFSVEVEVWMAPMELVSPRLASIFLRQGTHIFVDGLAKKLSLIPDH